VPPRRMKGGDSGLMRDCKRFYRCQSPPVIQLTERAGFRSAGLIGLIFVGIVAVGSACQVPVFRFALERWAADSYTIVIVPGARGELSAAEEEVRAFLQSKGSSDSVAVNLNVRIDSEDIGESAGATVRLFYPPKLAGSDVPAIWSGALNMENARTLVDSPARREIVTRLLSGESATWVLIESGDQEKDEYAASEIEKAFIKAEGVLKIPDGVLTVEEAGETSLAVGRDPDDALRSKIPLKIDFSLIRISRGDPAESIFLEMLMHLEDDLGEFADEPMVFPVFGRGRALEPLIGRGINGENVFEHASYFCGACSCEIKNQNPGVDLLIAANWEAAIAGSAVVVEKILPPLEGIGALIDGGAPLEGAAADVSLFVPVADAAAIASASVSGFTFRVPWVVVGAGVLLALGLGSVLILRKN
jgi:hypothetical protein